MTEHKTRVPAPFYAAAGVSDLAYQRLRKLPDVVAELRDRATLGGNELTGRAVATTAELRERAVAGVRVANTTAERLRERAVAGAAELEPERLREIARRNADTFIAAARVVQERAQAVYEDLVARGALVVGDTAGTVTEDAEAEAEAATRPEVPAKATAAPAARTSRSTAPKSTRTRAKATRPAKRTGSATR